ncbi:probable nicotianamine synthase 4 [Benincasa hispida]|uniref:probable nicotianamine synthase 4 n=1 Tax=Benincasa hispida TaxID=102211 RepID=UPI001900DF70|nr:probable nicotianamine synthase 4 [Benincasa hispida]
MEFEEAPLLQKISALYHQISSLTSLNPSKNVDTLFTQLVLTCSPPAPAGFDIASLSQPLQAMRAHLIRLCAKAEALLELHFSSILASSFRNPISNLSIFPYYSNYLKLSLLEFDILRSHCRRVPASIAFLGSGPLPLSSIVMASIHLKGTIFHNFDLDPTANSMASQLVCSDPDLSQRMIFHTTDVMNVTNGLKDYEVVFLAALVGLEEEEKGRVLKHLGKHMAAGAYLMLRSAHGARAFLYPVVDICDVEASGFEILSVFHPTDEVINSVVIARKKALFDRNSVEDEDDDDNAAEKRGILVDTSSIVLAEKCSGFNGFSPMVEEQLS